MEEFMKIQMMMKEEYCEEDIVNIEAQLINALDDLTKERRKNKSLKEELININKGSQNSNSEEVQQTITNLKFQIE